MEARQHIDDLRDSVEHIADDEKLLAIIDDQLPVLRQLFRSQRSAFTPGDIEFLTSLTGVLDHLRAFADLKEESIDVGSVREYEDIVIRLTQIKSALADIPVGKRVAKAIRELGEKLPAIQQNDEANRQFRRSGRIHVLEHDAPLCLSNHSMVIRIGSRGDSFWGCSRYPFCKNRAQLTPEQRDLLLPL